MDHTTLPVRWFVRGRIRSVCGCSLILDGAPMAYDVEFSLSSVQAIQKRHGVVSAQPALPAAGRLYVIHNDTTSRPVYVGTASDVQQRFVQRIAAVRELGFGNAHINPIEIHVYRVEVDGRPRPPDD